MLPLRYARYWRIASLLLMAAVLAAALAPADWLFGDDDDQYSWFPHADKVLHGITFLLLATQRTGSTVLWRTLDEHPSLRVRGEMFMQGMTHEASWPVWCERLDRKLLAYGEEFEGRMMDLEVNLPLEDQLDLGWEILAHHFTPEETGLPRRLIDQFWSRDSDAA